MSQNIERSIRDLREMDTLASGDSPIHAVSAGAKLLVTVVYILTVVSFDKYRMSSLLFMIFYPAVLFAVSGISVSTCFYKLRFVLPLVLAVGFDPSQGWVRESDGKNKAEMDSIIMATHIMLEAEDLGLGCTWIGSYEPSELYEAFPEMAGCEAQVLLALGYRAEDAHPGPWHPLRKSLDDIVTEL